MQQILNILAPVAMGLVVLVLGAGLWNMMRGGSRKRSQKLMRARVLVQFVAIILVMAALYFYNKG